jgi:GT2 family glycosyltransferase
MDVSIIIVNWNTKKLLKDCLVSIYEQTSSIDFEVIVVDNFSSDGSAEMVKAEFPKTILIENKENRGFAAANNQAIEIARGKYVLLLNSDTVVLDKAIEKTLSFADANPGTAAFGCRVLNPDGTVQTTCFMFPSILNMILSSTYLYKLFPGSKFFGREQMTWWDRNDVREVDVVTGCFILVRRETIEQTGTLDELFFMYGEETDWCYRMKKNGWKIMFTPAGQIIHYGGQSASKTPVAMTIQLRLSILKFIKKHYGLPSIFLARLLTALFFIVRLPAWFVVLLFRPSHRNEASTKLQSYSTGILNVLFGRLDIRK